jgi:PAS domain S-box-containing protein
MKKYKKTKESSLNNFHELKQRIITLEKENKLLKNELKNQKHREETLQESEKLYRTLVKTSPDAVAIHDLSTRIIEVSDKWLKMWGYDNPKEVVGRNGFEFMDKKDHQKAKDDMVLFLKNGFIENSEYTFIKKDGTRFIGELNGTLLLDNKGNPKNFLATTRDITQRKKAEGALRASEEMHKALLAISFDSVVRHKLDTEVMEVSQGTLNLFGMESSKEIVGRSGFEVIAPEDQERAKEIYNHILKKGYIKNLEISLVKRDGSHIIVESNVTVVKDKNGNPKGLIGSTRDITERKRAEEALRESEEMFRTLVKTSPDAIAVGELKEGKIIEMSDKTPQLFGFDNPDELRGRSGIEFMIPEDRERAKECLQKVVRGEDMRNMEFTYVKVDGTHFIGEVNASLLGDAHGKPKAIISITRDITDRKRAEEILKRSEQMLQREVTTLRKQIKENRGYTEIIGNSNNILHVIDLVQQIAPTNSTVLIFGETGSGKDLIAKAIHNNSRRKDSSFITLNCAALPEHLIESELFGYVKGAFTGAVQNKKGFFEEAHKGTIFLNEIGDIPIRLQGKLLQVLENQQINRLGQSRSITVDVRIIAATNKDLHHAVKNGYFREDLFYRLNVLTIKVPPLRDRKQDIPLLAKHFLDKYCPSMNKNITDISREAINTLCKYSYPGNVRELENIIQRSIIIAQGSTLLPQHLPEELIGKKTANAAKRIDIIEKKKILAILKECDGNLNLAADKLGMHRTTLWRKRKKLGI